MMEKEYKNGDLFYLCDMCTKRTPDIVGDEWCTGLNYYLALNKFVIDYDKQGPNEICKHFENISGVGNG